MIKKYLPKSAFAKNVLTLMTGATIAQAIPVAISPILTRIYTPEDFGIFALFVSLLTIIGSVANGRYELAIMLPEKEVDAINVFALGGSITIVLSVVLFVIIFLFNDTICIWLDNKEIALWLYLLPIAVIFTGFFNILNYYNNRQKNYRDLRNATIYRSTVLATSQLSLGFLKNGPIGLILGQVVALFFANYKLAKNIYKNRELIKDIDIRNIKAVSKKYKSFPIYSIPAVLANTLTFQLINILIPSFFSVATLGFYSLVNRVMGMPTSLVGSAIGQVFFQQASEEKKTTGAAIKTYKATLKKLLVLGFPIFTIAYFLVEDVFSFVFGEEWRIAGQYAKIITPLFFVRFIVSTLSPIDTVMEKQNYYLGFNVFLLSFSLLSFYLFKGFGFDIFLYFYTVVLSLVYLVYGIVLYFMAKRLI